MNDYDDPEALAIAIARCPRPVLIGLDVDGVLAPIVDHADDASLLAGVGDELRRLARLDRVHVAVVSGRAIEDLARFSFDDAVDVIGSHGMEARGRAMVPLDADERLRLARLDAAAERAASLGGDGAWVERKPVSVVLHVRQADEARGRRALDQLAHDILAIDGASAKAGGGVLEVFTRHASKGTAVTDLARRVAAATTVFVGDDVTDEEAFAQLADHDVAIKVGDSATIAAHRLRSPADVLTWLRHLT